MHKIAQQLIEIAREYRASEQDARFSNTYIAKDEHSGGGYKKFKQRIFDQCSDKVRQELGKYGVTQGTGVNLEIHHLNGSSPLHFIQRGHKSSYYTKLIQVLDGKIPYTYVKGQRVSKKKLEEQLKYIVFIPKWFHELCKTGELSKISKIEQLYDKMKEKTFVVTTMIASKLNKIAMLVLSYRMKLNNSQKSELTKYIEQIRFKKVNQKILGQFFYNLLTKGGLQIEQLQKSFNSLSKQQKQKYGEYINKLFPINNGVWAQINFNKNLSTKTDKTYNYYLNIQFPYEQDIVNYLKSLYQLMKQVKQLSDKHKCYVGFKTHATLTALLNHNDTLKFYFYDNKNELKNDLQQLVNNYINKNHLKRGKRLYDHGLDTQDDLGKQSFGQRLSNQLTKIFIDWIDKNKNKYTNQQFIQSFQRDLEIWIKNIAKKLV